VDTAAGLLDDECVRYAGFDYEYEKADIRTKECTKGGFIMTDALQNMPPGFKDRSPILVVCGVLEIFLGVLAGGMALLMVLMQVLARTLLTGASYNPSPPGMAMSLLVFAIAAVALIWLGIGSIKARRWARALMLTFSSLALAIGIMSFVAMLIVMPQMRAFTPPGAPEVPQGFMVGMMIFMMAIMFFIYIVLPTFFVLVYRSKHVKATCEWRDPKVRWTDKCPLPVLALSVLCAFGALSAAFAGFTMPVFPVPHGTVSGLCVGVAMVCMGVILACLARGTYKLNPTAWWTLLVIMVLCYLYGGTLMATNSLEWTAFYEAAGLPPEQIEMIEATGTLELMKSPSVKILMALSGCLYLGYLLYVKRFFTRPQPQ
jgi:hypothetical protein